MADIRHLVVLIMENRSFDHMLGYLASTGMDIDGLVGQSNASDDGSVVRGHHALGGDVVPAHQKASAANQIKGRPGPAKHPPFGPREHKLGTTACRPGGELFDE